MNKGRVFVYGRGDELPDDIIRFNLTSKSKDSWTRKFSPFFLGPVTIDPFGESSVTSGFVSRTFESSVPSGFVSRTFENAWQYLKVYPGHEDRDTYLEWATKGWNSEEAHRFPFGRAKKPLYSLWKGKRLNYIESRFKVYAPIYADLVSKYASDELKRLRDIIDSGKDIALFDYDGYNYIYNNVSLEEVMYNSRRKMGHAFVIAMLLTDNKVWEKDFDREKISQKSMKRSKSV